MNKNKFFFIALVLVGNFLPASLVSMPRQYLGNCQKSIENVTRMSRDASNSKDYFKVAITALTVANSIKTGFLNSREFRGDVKQKFDFVVLVLDLYTKAHEIFLHNKSKCDPTEMRLKVLTQYSLCNSTVQDKFQAKADEIFGRYELDIHQWFAEMRDFEREAILLSKGLL